MKRVRVFAFCLNWAENQIARKKECRKEQWKTCLGEPSVWYCAGRQFSGDGQLCKKVESQSQSQGGIVESTLQTGAFDRKNLGRIRCTHDKRALLNEPLALVAGLGRLVLALSIRIYGRTKRDFTYSQLSRLAYWSLFVEILKHCSRKAKRLVGLVRAEFLPKLALTSGPTCRCPVNWLLSWEWGRGLRNC